MRADKNEPREKWKNTPYGTARQKEESRFDREQQQELERPLEWGYATPKMNRFHSRYSIPREE